MAAVKQFPARIYSWMTHCQNSVVAKQNDAIANSDRALPASTRPEDTLDAQLARFNDNDWWRLVANAEKEFIDKALVCYESVWQSPESIQTKNNIFFYGSPAVNLFYLEACVRVFILRRIPLTVLPECLTESNPHAKNYPPRDAWGLGIARARELFWQMTSKDKQYVINHPYMMLPVSDTERLPDRLREFYENIGRVIYAFQKENPSLRLFIEEKNLKSGTEEPENR